MAGGAKDKNSNTTILTAHQLMALNDIANEDYFSKIFYLTGGTALSEFYLKHRLSEDLDFFSEEEVAIHSVTKYIETRNDAWQVEKLDTRNVYGLWTFFLKFNDTSDLKIDFNYYPFPRIEKGKIFKKMAIDSIDLLHNNFSSRNVKILREARKDDEGVYGEYTPRRTDEAAAKIFTLQ